jgi:DNA-binding NarL/FixJ family response regulator
MIVDDMPKHRLIIENLVTQIHNCIVIASLNDGDKVLHWFANETQMPDIIILDIQMPKMDGISVMEYLTDFYPLVKVIALSSHNEKNIINQALAAGVMSFVWKHNNCMYLNKAIELVKNNTVYIDERIDDPSFNRTSLMAVRQLEKDILHSNYQLSTSEYKVLKILTAQINYIEIGYILHLSPRTLETYVGRLNKKLNIISGGRQALFYFALRIGMVKVANLTNTVMSENNT